MKKDVPKDLAKFTEKYLCQSFVFNKVACLSPLLQNTSGRLLRIWEHRNTHYGSRNIHFFLSIMNILMTPLCKLFQIDLKKVYNIKPICC